MFIAAIYLIIAMVSFFLQKIISNYTKKLKINFQKKFISVILPLRNEEKRLQVILESLEKQDYPKELYEVIIVDDRSTDLTYERSKNFKDRNKNFKILRIKEENKKLLGKENAIHLSILESKGEVIFTTDAGCILEPSTLFNINILLVQDVDVVLCKIAAEENKTFFYRFQTIVERILISVFTLPTIFNYPIGGRGAGMAFRKECYLKIGGYPKIGHSIIEDIALIKNFKKNNFRFVVSNLLINKEPKHNLKELILQHRRWVRGTLTLGFIPLFLIVNFYYFSSLFFLYKTIFDFKFYIFMKMLSEYIIIRNLSRDGSKIFSFFEEIFVSLIAPFYYIAVFTYALIPTKIKWK